MRIIISLLISNSISASSFDVGKNAFTKIYDGDSVNVRFRLAGIDTPEIRGKCEEEKQLAIQARDYTRAFIEQSRKVSFETHGVGRYGRPLVDIYSEHGHLRTIS